MERNGESSTDDEKVNLEAEQTQCGRNRRRERKKRKSKAKLKLSESDSQSDEFEEMAGEWASQITEREETFLTNKHLTQNAINIEDLIGNLEMSCSRPQSENLKSCLQVYNLHIDGPTFLKSLMLIPREQTLPVELEKIRDLLYSYPALINLCQNTNSIEDNNHTSSVGAVFNHPLTHDDIQADCCYSIEKPPGSPQSKIQTEKQIQKGTDDKNQPKYDQIEMKEILSQEQAQNQTQTEAQAQTQPSTSSTNTIQSQIHSETHNQEKLQMENDTVDDTASICMTTRSNNNCVSISGDDIEHVSIEHVGFDRLSADHLVSSLNIEAQQYSVSITWKDILQKICGTRDGFVIPHSFCLAILLGTVIVALILGLKFSGSIGETPNNTESSMSNPQTNGTDGQITAQ